MASVTSFETDMRKLRRKRRSRKVLRDVIIAGVILLLILTVYFTRDLWIGHFEGIFQRNNSGYYSGDQSYLDISGKNNVIVNSSDRFLTIYSDTTLATYNVNGGRILNITAAYSNPAIEASGTRALIYDLGGSDMCVVGTKEEIFSRKLNDQILFAVLGENGNVAVVTSSERYKSFLTIYDKNGYEIFRWADGNLITAVALDKDGKGCLAATVYANGGMFNTVVSKLDFSKTEVVSTTEPLNTFTIDLKYAKDGGAWLIGDQSLTRLGSDNTVKYTYLYKYRLSGYSADKDVCALTFNGVSENKSYVSVFSQDKESVTELSFENDICCVKAHNGKVYLASSKSFYGLNSHGTSLGEIELSESCKNLTILQDYVYFQGIRSISMEKLDF